MGLPPENDPGFRVPTTLEEALVVIARLVEVNLRLQARVEELERQLGQNSQNSSRPPSSDPPSVSRREKKKSGRKPGGQPGHKGHQRELLSPERVDKVVEVWPDHCEGCHADLPARLRTEVGEPERHQVSEIPELRAEVTEFRLHSQVCTPCGWATTAELPDGVPTGAFGPRLQGILATLSGYYRLSKRSVREALADLFGVPISTGSVVACEQRTSEVLRAAVEEARRYVEQQSVVHADETGWREKLKRAWLWVAGTALVVVFLIHPRRNGEAAKKLLRGFAGVLVVDRWSAYRGHQGRRQLCWSHLLRDFEGMAGYSARAGEIGADLVKKTKAVLRYFRRVRDGTITRAHFKERTAARRGEIEMLILEGAECAQSKVAGSCNDIWRQHESLWTFVDVDGVDPTNNFGERILRPGVLYRKGCFGTHSEGGSRFVERMLTVGTTLRLQGRSVVDYVVASCERALQKKRPLSLLPGRSHVVPASCARAAA